MYIDIIYLIIYFNLVPVLRGIRSPFKVVRGIN